MDFKFFMTSVEQRLSRFKDVSELKEWIQNYARSLPEEAREDFLEQLQETEQRSHKEKLDEIIAWCKKLENERSYFLATAMKSTIRSTGHGIRTG